MSWILLFLAGLAEVCWALALRYCDGWSRPLPLAVALAGLVASVILLALAVREVPLGTAYAVWTAIGVVGTTLAGILWWKEVPDLSRLVCLALIVAGVIGLKWTSG
ncbi:DMT family transporter [Tahibacter amnicola]|uniref:Guanidinium exporter n=1 Tax=Tahibacter amnicola TaxID=2976241 RepID=A0ABY6BPS9_9GAMM|nr:multidrug efflux SMR transporter [Tahibacter amnicola]UXI69777.1 multidrug efflux SMR transporter [Tahibacter amnicola]